MLKNFSEMRNGLDKNTFYYLETGNYLTHEHYIYDQFQLESIKYLNGNGKRCVEEVITISQL